MTEVLFYHLTTRPLEGVLPALLEKTLARGWRAVVRAGTPERLETLNRHLWTYRDESFLPHGVAADGFAEDQPIYLTCGAETPNRADAQFLVDGGAGDLSAFPRSVLMFDARDAAAVDAARGAWRGLQGTGAAAAYWRQDESGRWIKHAEMRPSEGDTAGD